MEETHARKASTVTCLTCGIETSETHLGVDICRACTVFHRRFVKYNRQFICRTGLNECAVKRERFCKKCRIARIQRLLHQNKPIIPGDAAEPEKEGELPEEVSRHSDPPATEIVEMPISSVFFKFSSTPLLECLQRTYNRLTELRVDEESRIFACSSAEIVGIVPSTYCPARLETIHNGNFDRFVKGMYVLVNSMYKVAPTLFEMFPTRTAFDQWAMIRNFYETFAMLETVYRSEKFFPDNFDLNFGAFTTLNNANAGIEYFGNFPGDHDGAMSVYNRTQKIITDCRRDFKRDPIRDDIELLAAVGLAMWNADDVELPQPIIQLMDEHRNQLLRELHNYYKNVLKIDEYAVRIGRLFAVVAGVKRSLASLRENFEMYYLLGLSRPGTLEYQLLRA